MSDIVILFGEMGSGKNYWGEKLANESGCLFVDGDDFILPEMIEIVTKFRPIPKKILTSFVNRLANEVANLAEHHDKIVVAQALYFNEDRLFMKRFLHCLGHNVTFKWVRAPFFQNMRQIFSRNLGTAWVIYWLLNKPWFQNPTHECEIIK